MTDWGAKVLEGVPRTNNWSDGEPYIKEADALAAIARMGAGDGLVERHADKERNVLLNTALSDLDKIINGHNPEVDTSINNLVWDRLDKLAVAIEAKAADRIAVLTAQNRETALDVLASSGQAAEAYAAQLAAEAERGALRERVARLEGALTDMPKAVLRTTVCQGPQWPDDRPGVWLAALEACAKSVQTAVNAALPAADARPVQDDAASRRRKIMGHMDDRAAADARAEALKEALQALRGAGSFGRTAAEKHAALEQYCLCRDAILALIPEKQP